jgi:hypothetical protein
MEAAVSGFVPIIFAILGLAFILAMIAGLVFAWWYPSRQKRKVASLKTTGVRGEATVVEYQITPTDPESDDIAWVRLEMQVPDMAPYILEKRAPLRYAGLLKEGMQVTVWVDKADPQNPERVVIEIQHTR